jgi:ubiquinone/menaquinone biosynthesis C-methylase UbiE
MRPARGFFISMMPPWYVSAFGEYYSELYHHRNESDARQAVDFVRRHPRLEPLMGEGPRGRVLDLCCGSGRHYLTWLEEAPNAKLTGLDLSPNLLDEAAQSIRRIGAPVRLARGDMRHLPFRDGAFRLVLNLFTSFGYFAEDAENAGVFREVARVLDRTGGFFLFDHLNPTALRAGLVAESRRQTPSGAWVHETRWIDEKRRRVEKRIEFEPNTGQPVLLESVRFYEPEEVTTLGDQAGLSLLSSHGGFDASPLTERSPRGLYVFQKRA